MTDSGPESDPASPVDPSVDTVIQRDLDAPSVDDTFDRERSRNNVTAALLGIPSEAAKIGPFFVLQRLGAGGMGVVYAAYDPRLDRKVAIKLLQPADATPSDSGRVDEEARERLLREARALAKLTHPNVVTVHEVGLHEDEVYVAMAFIEGQTLREWIDEKPHDIFEVLEVMTAAGFGLAAAHDAGIIHRDFKPQNVLMGEGGTVCVADFGLAREESSDGAPPHAPIDEAQVSSDPLSASGSASGELTQAGSLLGTPLYMAPEQHFSEPVHAATDQFAFCLTLYEALTGEFPLPQDMLALVGTKSKGKIPRPERTAKGERIPPWLASTIMRGLAPDWGDRHPDMHALLAELEPPRPIRRQLMIGAGLAIVGLAAVPLVLGGDDGRASTPPCAPVAQEMDSVWNDRRDASIRDAMSGVNATYGGQVWDAVAPRIDNLAARWKEARIAVCELAVGGAEPDPLVARRLECLDRARLRLAGALAVLEQADRDVVDRANLIFEALPGPGTCLSTRVTFSREWTPPDPEALDTRRAAQAELAQIDPMVQAGRYEEARQRLDALAASVDPQSDPFVAAEYHTLAAVLSRDSRREHTARALAAALRSGSDHLMMTHTLNLGHRAVEDHRPAEAELAATLGLAVADRMAAEAEDDPYLLHASIRGRSQLHDLLGQTYGQLNQPSKAAASFAAALAGYAVLEGVEGLVGQAYNNLGELYRYQGNYRAAIDAYEAALEAKAVVLGPRHPTMGAILNNRAAAHADLGHIEESLRDMRSALTMIEADREDEANFVALTRFNIGLISAQLGDFEEAQTMLAGARSSFAGMVAGRPGAYVPVADAALATLALRRGDQARALELIESTVATIDEEGVAPKPVVGSVVAERAMILTEVGRSEEALVAAERAVELLDASLGAHSLSAALAWSVKAHALSAQRRDEEARAAYEHSRAIFDGIGNPTHPHLAELHVGLAVLDARAGRSRDAAHHREQAARVLAAHPGLKVWVEDALGESSRTVPNDPL